MLVQTIKPNKKILKWAKSKKAKILITKNPSEAANLADCVMTDKWISMGDKGNKNKKKKLLKSYQVNKKIMKLANQMQFLCIVFQLTEEKKLPMR